MWGSDIGLRCEIGDGPSASSLLSSLHGNAGLLYCKAQLIVALIVKSEYIVADN